MTWTQRNNGLMTAGWWLPAGVQQSEVVAAYQPVGARTQAESYWNLAAVGTNDAAAGVAPTWAAATGWTFDGATTYLTTGITPGQSYTIIVRAQFTAAIASAAGIVSQRGTNSELAITASVTALPGPNYRPSYVFRWANGTTSHAPGGGGNPQDDTLALAGSVPYYNGTAQTTVSGTWGSAPIAIFIGADNVAGAAANFFQGNILAVAVYNVALTAAQIATITTSMDALTSADTPFPALRVNYIAQHPATKRLPSTAHELLIATDGGVFQSFNGGRSWAQLTLPDPSNSEFSDSPAATVDELTFHWVDYDPTDSNTVYVLAAKSSVSRVWVYKSADALASWSSRGITIV